MRGVQGGSGGPGVSKGVQGVPAGHSGLKHENAPELCGQASTEQHQDFVQEVPVAQMAQGPPFGDPLPRNLRWTSQVSNTPPKGRRIPPKDTDNLLFEPFQH